LHKSLSAERTKFQFSRSASLDEAGAPAQSAGSVEISVKCDWLDKSTMLHKKEDESSDLGEGGMALRLPNSTPATGVWQLSFFVPQALDAIKVGAEVAWRNPQGLVECGLPTFLLRRGSN